MKNVRSRVKELREYLNLSQESFGSSIGLSKSGISNIESGLRNVTEKHILLIKGAFNVNEEWLRTGEGSMFVEPDTFSLDEYAKQRDLSELEVEIIKSIMEIPADIRTGLISHFKVAFNKHTKGAPVEDFSKCIEEELEKYRLELEAERKGETSSASQDTDEKNGNSA